ncbi:MAG: FAD-dependent oxidoreductase [Myxococcota bacterium]
MSARLPVAVIGAGPIGLAAAAHLLSRGIRPLLIERAPKVGGNIASWRHVRLFSNWAMNIDPAARGLLERAGWKAPDAAQFPSGGELVDEYLEPLARVPQIAENLKLNTSVKAVTRVGLDRTAREDWRALSPFRLHLSEEGRERYIQASAVIDASGNLLTPNPLGGEGAAAMGEPEARRFIRYGIPDVEKLEKGSYLGKRTLVVGSGHSAFNALVALSTLIREDAATRIIWAVRRPDAKSLLGGRSGEPLEARTRLTDSVREMLARGSLSVETDFWLTHLKRSSDGITAYDEDRALPVVDQIICATGYRPDLSMLRELQLSLDPVFECPKQLAELVDARRFPCGSAPAHGIEKLVHPETGFFVVGSKSYGRASTFLLTSGYEQVRSIAAALAGDRESSLRTEITMPAGSCGGDCGTGCCTTETGSGGCGTSGCGAGGGCCAPSPKAQRPSRASTSV